MMTGHYQNYNGGNQHRTRGKQPLPYGIKPIPHILEEAGYYTASGCGLSGKTDCNFSTARKLFMKGDYAGAERLYAKAAVAKDSRITAAIGQARALRSQGKYSKAKYSMHIG